MPEHEPISSEQEQIPPIEAFAPVKVPYFERHPEQVRPEDLNNFHTLMPNSDYLARIESQLDKPNIDNARPAWHSDLWKSQTRRQFAQIIEGELSQLPELNQNVRGHIHDGQLLNTELVPLYLALRARGYSHYDLII